MGGRPNYGPTAQERTKRLLEALLAYANDELEGSERLSQLLCLNATAYQLALHPNFSQADTLVVGKVVTLGRLGFPGNSLYSIYLQTAVSS